MAEAADIAIVGAGAAGLMAAIWAGRSPPPLLGEVARNPPGRGRGGAAGNPRRIILLDGAKKLGAKILVAGGGRCNVTHFEVDERQYAGSSPHAIKKVLRQFDVPRTVEFFRELGVEFKREETGKLFPTTDDAHTVLSALLTAAADAGVHLQYPWRVGAVRRDDDGFVIEQAAGDSNATGGPATPPQPSPEGEGVLHARRLILATGGKSLPRTGSDGLGYQLAKSLGHSITRTLPALVPLTLPKEHFLCSLSGITLPATLEVRAQGSKKLASFTNSTLLTHFGLSGPSVLDISRYYLDAIDRGDNVQLIINFLPGETPDSLETKLAAAGREQGATTLLTALSRHLPDRLARAFCTHTAADPATQLSHLAKATRRALAIAATALPLPITGSRGYTYAEVTAGGVPLSELHLDTMESRICPGLYLCGEICDVDGRIGGFNFQWAWASGYVAGSAAGGYSKRA